MGSSISTIEVLENFPSINTVDDIELVLQTIKLHKIQNQLTKLIGAL